MASLVGFDLPDHLPQSTSELISQSFFEEALDTLAQSSPKYRCVPLFPEQLTLLIGVTV